VQLHEGTSTVDKLALIEELRGTFSQVAGAKIEVKNFEQGPPVVAPVEVRLVGDNLDTLRALAFKVEKILKATPGTIYIDNPVSNLKSDIKVAINKEKASQLGVPSVEIDRTVRLAVAGLQAGSFSGQDGDDYKIMVGRERGAHPTLDALSNLYINNIQGVAVPLSQLASLQMDASPTIIRHFDKKRTVSVSAFLKKGYQSNKVIEEVVKSTDKLKLPAGYSYNMGGDVEAQQDSFGGFEILIVITVFAFIAVLVLEFKTFKSTLIVLSVIPLGVVGASIAHWLTGNPLSFVAIIGLIALAGIEVKNSILLVDFTNQLRAEGRSLEDAIREAGEIRFLPIVLTSLTAIGGLIPIALSTNPLISPLADVLIGGLVSSTLLSRVITPVIYKLLPPNVELLATNTNTAPAQATH
jgi:multidrug efflux pump subunit AcrB